MHAFRILFASVPMLAAQAAQAAAVAAAEPAAAAHPNPASHPVAHPLSGNEYSPGRSDRSGVEVSGGWGDEVVGGGGGGGVLPQQPLCAGRATPQCCELDASGIIAVTCKAPPGEPSNKQSLQQACASEGKGSKCCLLSIAGIAVNCNAP